MSTWTCKTLSLVVAATLAACGSELDLFGDAPLKVRLPSGVVVEGSRGWCAHPEKIESTGAASVVVLGSCEAISGLPGLPRPGVPGVLTVSVDNDALGTAPVPALDAYFATEQGRAALARDGRAESVRILESRQSDDALFLHAVDRSGFPSNAAEDYWRAIFDLDGRFVTVSLVALNDDPIAREVGLRTLKAQVRQLRAANRSVF